MVIAEGLFVNQGETEVLHFAFWVTRFLSLGDTLSAALNTARFSLHSGIQMLCMYFQNCMSVLDSFRKVPALHMQIASNCVSQWPITSITGYLHNVFPFMHADIITACTNGVSDCRCKSVDAIMCIWATKSNSVWTAIAPVTMVLLHKTRESGALFWPGRILLPADWNGMLGFFFMRD